MLFILFVKKKKVLSEDPEYATILDYPLIYLITLLLLVKLIQNQFCFLSNLFVASILEFCWCVADHYKLNDLTHICYFIVSVGQRSRHSFMRLQLKLLARVAISCKVSTGEGCTCKLMWFWEEFASLRIVEMRTSLPSQFLVGDHPQFNNGSLFHQSM